MSLSSALTDSNTPLRSCGDGHKTLDLRGGSVDDGCDSRRLETWFAAGLQETTGTADPASTITHMEARP
jgi:hypothetical protein